MPLTESIAWSRCKNDHYKIGGLNEMEGGLNNGGAEAGLESSS